MGRIKSALEIALERTETVKSDKAGIAQYEARQQGKKLANAFLANQEIKIEDELKKTPEDRLKNFKEGIFEVLVSLIALPASEEDRKRIEAAGRGLQSLAGGGRFAALCGQLNQVLAQYLNEAAGYDQAIRQQYAPKLRQKEEELSRRMGREVRIDPFQDPEFIGFYNQNINALKANYQPVVDQVREEARRIFEERQG